MTTTLPLTITERLEIEEVTRERIRDKAGKLTRFFDRITSCKVTLDQPHRKRHTGNPFMVTVEVTAPGADLIAHGEHHQDLNIAIREAFDAAKRQLEDYSRKLRGEVKTHNNHTPAPAEPDEE